jgi:hypothetical protein
MRRHNQKDKMKTKSLSLLAIIAAALSLNVTTATAQYVDSVASLNNRAVAASPRAKEAFPWLTRAPSPRAEACCAEATAKNELTAVKKNGALAASPRGLEQFPELARSAAPRQEFTIAPLVDKDGACSVQPSDARGVPYAHARHARHSPGGASKLMEFRK